MTRTTASAALAAGALALAAAAPGAGAAVITTAAPPGGAPATVGACASTTVASIGDRVSGQPGSGTAVAYANGLAQVSYAIAPQVADWRVGDEVRVCLVHSALHCPLGKSRGGFYEATDRRTNTSWVQPDTTLACNG